MPDMTKVIEDYRARPAIRFRETRWTRYDDDMIADCKAITLLGFEAVRLFPQYKIGLKQRADLTRLEHVEYVNRAIGERWLAVEFTKRNFYVSLDYPERPE